MTVFRSTLPGEGLLLVAHGGSPASITVISDTMLLVWFERSKPWYLLLSCLHSVAGIYGDDSGHDMIYMVYVI